MYVLLLGCKVGVGGDKSVKWLGCNEVGNKYVMGRGLMGNRVLGFGEFSAAVSFLCTLS